MTADAKHQRDRYRTDADYRKRRIQQNCDYVRRLRRNPVKWQMRELARTIIRARAAYERMSARAERAYMRLVGLTSKLEILKKQGK